MSIENKTDFKKPRIALVFTGLFRLYPDSINDLINKFNLKNYDIFGFFWEPNKEIDLKNIEYPNFKQIHFVKPFFELSYLPSNFMVYSEESIPRILSMFQLRYTASSFLNLDEYDYFIITRPDLTVVNKVDIYELVKNNFKVFLPVEGGFQNGFTDNLAIIKREYISTYLSTINRLKILLKKSEQNIWGLSPIKILKNIYNLLRLENKNYNLIAFHPESLVKEDILLNCVNFKKFKTGGIILNRGNHEINALGKFKSEGSFTISRLKRKYVLNKNDFKIDVKTFS